MAADEKKTIEETNVTEAGGQAQAKVVYDDSKMRSVYANFVNVTGGREELVLLFGMNQAWHAGQKEIKVELTDRIVLNPFAAKRLGVLLTNLIQNYESKFGALDIETRRPDDSALQ